MITYVALPYQIYHLTQSSLAVGTLGIVELVPLLVTALIGGAVADSMDRRKLLLGSELALTVCSLILILNAVLAEPRIWVLYLMAGIMSGITGFHRPALESMGPRLVDRADLPAMSVLSTLRFNLSMIGGPALGGFCLAELGLPWTFAIDMTTFMISLVALFFMKALPPTDRAEPLRLRRLADGLRYAVSRPELLGTYLIDFTAMIFGMPVALFPAIAESFGGPKILGWLYAAPAIGALVPTLLSGWIRHVHRHGVVIVISASLWGASIIAFGLSTEPLWALIFLACAGAADGMSGIFRLIMWNETIPDRLRGRMSAIEMLSYTSGPLLGNAEAGFVAAAFGTRVSVVSGGALCIAGVVVGVLSLPQLWRYDSRD